MQKTCQFCGKEYESGNDDEYCSSECKEDAEK